MDFKGLLWEGMDWIHLAHNKGQRWTLVDKSKNSNYIKCRELLKYNLSPVTYWPGVLPYSVVYE